MKKFHGKGYYNKSQVAKKLRLARGREAKSRAFEATVQQYRGSSSTAKTVSRSSMES